MPRASALVGDELYIGLSEIQVFSHSFPCNFCLFLRAKIVSQALNGTSTVRRLLDLMGERKIKIMEREKQLRAIA
jgi:hypothetical protein